MGLPIFCILIFIVLLRFIPLCISTYFNIPSIVKLQIAIGADLNSSWLWNETPLMTASYTNRLEIFELLIKANADVNARVHNFYGETVLHRSSRDGCYECVAILLQKGIEVNVRDSVGRTAVYFASDQPTIVKAILTAGGDPNIPDVRGNTPLMSAVKSENIETIKVLLLYGATTESVSLNGETAGSIAEMVGNERIRRLLKGRGEDSGP